MRDKGELMAQQRHYMDEIFSLMDAEGKDEVRRRFEELASDTVDALIAARMHAAVPFTIDPDDASCWSFKTWQHHRVDSDLVERWQRWAAEYPDLQARNPKLDLHDALCWCSETHDAAPWPDGYERAIYDWVASERIEPPPFNDCMHIVNAKFVERLRRLQATVDGWLVRDKATNRVVHVPWETWRRG